eukprot:4737545-Pleurochrysis_carterae.AAC.2
MVNPSASFCRCAPLIIQLALACGTTKMREPAAVDSEYATLVALSSLVVEHIITFSTLRWLCTDRDHRPGAPRASQLPRHLLRVFEREHRVYCAGTALTPARAHTACLSVAHV